MHAPARPLMSVEHVRLGRSIRAEPHGSGSADCGLPLVTVVVCTRDRPRELERCLESLDGVDDPNYEVVVVDNGALPTVRSGADGFRAVHERRRGLDFARNRGVLEARGDIIAFIDDDCEAGPGWLRGLRSAFDDHAAGCVTGRVVPGSLDRAAHRWFEHISTFDRGRRSRRFSRRKGARVLPGYAAQVGTGCNMAFRRELLDSVGEFDVALDMGTAVGGGGDIDMFVRVLREGSLAVYAPDAVVRHHHRETLSALARQLFGYSASVGALSAKYVLDRKLGRRAALRHQWEWFRWIVHATLLRPRGRRVVGLPLLVVCTLGNLFGPFAYLLSRLRAQRIIAA